VPDTQLVWLRRDLRLADNPALYHAAKAGPVVCVYVFDNDSPKHHAYGGASRWWLHHSLESLGKSLKAKGSKLILRRGDAVDVLTKLAAETGAAAVQANRHYEPWWRNCERKLAETLDLVCHDGNYLMRPGSITTGSDGTYKIYTPFSRALRAGLPPRDELPVPERLDAPASWPASDDLASWNLLPVKPDWAGGLRDFWQVGEAAAQARMHWWADHVDDYEDKRNLPSEDKVSRLSPYLHWGEISPVQVWHAHKDRRSNGWDTYEGELIWRDFAQNAILQFPAYATQNYRAEFDRFPWRDPDSDDSAACDLRAWQQGRTGYPMVDAGMRQLWRTGWMHNRVRMITASFLIKHLLIDWRHGEKWFWNCLVDADYASNAINWQWTAGTGVDSNMFVRIMAPLSQSEKFGAGGYIRKYVPELEDVPEAHIHDPEEAGLRPRDYPRKIVPHREARERALAAYKIMKAG
jgi:deoxyribodipyrimidine photo-lyase